MTSYPAASSRSPRSASSLCRSAASKFPTDTTCERRIRTPPVARLAFRLKGRRPVTSKQSRPPQALDGARLPTLDHASEYCGNTRRLEPPQRHGGKFRRQRIGRIAGEDHFVGGLLHGARTCRAATEI